MANFNTLSFKHYERAISQIKETNSSTDIEDVKAFLLKEFNVPNWKTFIKMQEYGTCAELAELISLKFPNFKLVSGEGNLSDKAKKRLKPESVADECFVHYFNYLTTSKTYYDFGKGTNRENGTYLLQGLGKIDDVNLTTEELNHYYYIKTVLRR